MASGWRRTATPQPPFVVSGASLQNGSVGSQQLTGDMNVSGTLNTASGLKKNDLTLIDSAGRWLGPPGGATGDVGENSPLYGVLFGNLDLVPYAQLSSYPQAKTGAAVFCPDVQKIYIHDGTRFVAIV